MATKSLWVIFSCMLFLSTAVFAVWGQSTSLGVNAGDTFVYSYNETWQSNQTGVTPPSSIIDQSELQYIATAIMSVDGTSVKTNTSYCFATGIWMEIVITEYGGGYIPYFIPSNIGAGDPVPGIFSETSPIYNVFINETINQIYVSQIRSTNHLQIEFPYEGFMNVVCNAHWDQATGVLTKAIYSYSNQTGETATNWLVKMELIETSLFTISDAASPFPSPSQSPSETPQTSPSPPPTIPYLSYGIVVIIAVLATIFIFFFLRHKARANSKLH